MRPRRGEKALWSLCSLSLQASLLCIPDVSHPVTIKHFCLHIVSEDDWYRIAKYFNTSTFPEDELKIHTILALITVFFRSSLTSRGRGKRT